MKEVIDLFPMTSVGSVVARVYIRRPNITIDALNHSDPVFMGSSLSSQLSAEWPEALSLNALVSTETELRDRPRPRISGSAATAEEMEKSGSYGILITLYPKAQNRFCLMFLIVLLLSRTAGRHAHQVASHQDDVRGFDRHVGPRSYRDTDVGLHEGRRVVDAVSTIATFLPSACSFLTSFDLS